MSVGHLLKIRARRSLGSRLLQAPFTRRSGRRKGGNQELHASAITDFGGRRNRRNRSQYKSVELFRCISSRIVPNPPHSGKPCSYEEHGRREEEEDEHEGERKKEIKEKKGGTVFIGLDKGH